MSRIVILGSGTVGEVTGRVLLDHNHEVEFRDSNPERVSILSEVGLKSFSVNEPQTKGVDFFFVCVPTPNYNGEPDLSHLQSALEFAAQVIGSQETFSVVVIRSTVPVGTAIEVAVPLIKRISRKQPGVDFGVCSNPEYLREEYAKEDAKSPRAIIIGTEEPRSLNAMNQLYEPFTAPIHHLSTKEAEMHKYTHNLLNTSKISFFNEQRQVCEALEIDANAIFPLVAITAEASWNPLYGTKDKGAFEGSCLPKDLEGFIGWVWNHLQLELPLLSAIKTLNDELRHKSASRLTR